MFNVHNIHHWTRENPRATFETHFQVRWSINVSAGIIGKQIDGFFFFNDNITTTSYLNFLRNKLPELLENLLFVIRRNLIFQQDGASPQFGKPVRDFLNKKHPGWIA
ncbi:hypothetical protein ANTRET_LOCUS5468 [Anthophora retusa]